MVGMLVFTAMIIGQFSTCIAEDGPALGDRCNPHDDDWHPGDVPAFSWLGQCQVLGLALFSFSYVVTIPSWANEKKPHVDVNRAVWWPAGLSVALQLLIGMMGAFAFQLVQRDGAAIANMDVSSKALPLCCASTVVLV
eukprot:COSAG02_NODE_16628_length_1069_cov_1.497938_1_plen_138_part_00